MSCQDMEVEKVKSLEEMGVVPSAVSHPSGRQDPSGSTSCVTRSSAKTVPSVHVFAAIVVEDGGNPHTIDFCRN